MGFIISAVNKVCKANKRVRMITVDVNIFSLIQQFFFAPEVTELLLDTVKTHSFDGVVCIGAPSIHESLQQSGDESTVKSFLLDIDVRLVR